MATPIHHRGKFFRFVTFRTVLAVLFLAPLAASSSFAQSSPSRKDEKPKVFDIAATEAPAALKQFTAQSGEQLVFSTEEVQDVTTNAVRGSMATREALDRLLAGTSLSATRDEKSGALAVGRKESPEKNAVSRGLAEPLAPKSTGRNDDTVVLSAFEVTTTADKGYRASNSVSGSRVDTPIMDLPFAIQAFTAEFIQDIRPEGFIDLVRYAPGVSAQNFGFTTGDTGVVLRGFSIGTFAAPLRDGLIGPATFSFNGAERVEIIKGPASFLYGQLAPGGMINVITKTPLQKSDNRISLTTGSYNYFQTQLDVGGKIGNTGFAYRLPVLYEKDMNYWDPYESRIQDFAPSASWSYKDRLSVVVGVERYVKNETPPLAQYPILGDGSLMKGLPMNFNSASYLDYRKNQNTEATVTFNLKVSEHWTARARYGKNWSKVRYRFTGVPWFWWDPTNMPRWAKDQYNSDETDSYEADMVGRYKWGGTSLRILAGYSDRKDSYHQYGHVRGDWNTPYDWNMTNPSTWNRYYIGSDTYALRWDDSNDKNRDKGYYAGVTLGLFKDRLMVLAGARRTENDKSGASTWVDNTAEAVKAGKAGPGSLAMPNHHAAATTPQVGVLYKLTPEISAYASYSESFVPSNAYLLKAWVPTGDAKPTHGSGYEAGIKTSLLDGRVSSTLTVYSILNNDILRHIDYPNPANPSQILEDTVQSGQDESKGVEFDINYTPVDHWQIYASYSYDDAGVKSDAQYPERPGRRLVNSVRNTANFWTKYNFTSGVLKNAFIGGGFNYIGGQVYDETPGTYREYTTLLNAIAGYRFKVSGHPLTMTVNGKNLSNRIYRPGVAGNGRPREIQFTFSTNF